MPDCSRSTAPGEAQAARCGRALPAPHVAGAEPRAIAAHLLGHARSWAFFAVDSGGLRLVTSDRIDRSCLDDVAPLGGATPVPDPETAGETTRSRLILLVPQPGESQVHGLLYLETPPAHSHLLLRLDLHEMSELLRASMGAPAPVTREELDAVSNEAVVLRTLLQQHEWNVARVARSLGVTRMTVYNRMQRYAIPRVKMPKAAFGARRAASPR